MPFTFSHPAVVLSLTKYSGRYVSSTGLIIGSMTPDFEYFFRMKIQSNFSHTWTGLFYFDLPVGILIAFLFHNGIRNSLYDNIPQFFSDRLRKFETFNWNEYFKKHFLVVIYSTLIGATTHLIWDSLTHVHGYLVSIFPLLQKTFQIAEHDIPIYKLLQHLSTLLGGILISIVFINLPKTNEQRQNINVQYWICLLTIIILIVFTRVAFGLDKIYLGQLIVTAVTAIIIGLTLTPILIRQNK